MIQKRHPIAGNLNRETSGDSKNTFLQCGDVLEHHCCCEIYSYCYCCHQCCYYCDWYCKGDLNSHCYCQCCCYCDLSLCLFLVLSRNVSASSCLEAGTQVVYVWHEDSVFQMGYIQETPIFLHHKAVCIVVEPTCLPDKSCQAVAGLSKSCDSA